MEPVNHETRARYDDLPYSSYAYQYSAPEQLAAVASLFGLPSAGIATARVLELGCGAGGNLVPVALRHPACKAVGVDISRIQIDEGKGVIDRLGIGNISLVEADLLELDAESLGEFDYIIAHGVYSWVPRQVQEAMLALIHRCLAPDGVAYISYNTYPGWKTKEIVRDAMLMHGGARPTATEQVAYGRSMLGFLKQTALAGGLTAAAVDECMAQVMNGPIDYVAHEYLAPYNQPCYFHEFVRRVEKHGLAYLGEAQPSMMMPSNYNPELSRQLYGALGGDQVRVEQYLDFAVSRVFRQTLLVHAERAAGLRWELDRGALHGMHFASRLATVGGPIVLDGQPQEFVAPPNTANISVALSGIKQAIDLLAKTWPGTVTRDEMIRYAYQTQGGNDAVSAEVLGGAIDELCEKLVLRGMAQVRLAAVAVVPASGDRPVVDPVVRKQLASLAPHRKHVANAWHDSVEVMDIDRLLFPLMDGTVDRAELIAATVDALRDGRLSPPVDGNNDLGTHASAAVADMLQRMEQSAVLSRSPVQ
ncbi:methyltransferase domain-containing protein [Luteimonas aestuarii]|uniref:Methyltransferase domain-containing protein n=1 Tax=Luteimonas aestuarii TaxID=453837 RepID=A0A4R5TTW7_9GAMM|nr:class I SAM-dependent methyltransferase [Luteimonas aestuarii]TDK24458.1 methyltransferase domain-containing protein [Luteimonas aestuarii]